MLLRAVSVGKRHSTLFPFPIQFFYRKIKRCLFGHLEFLPIQGFISVFSFTDLFGNLFKSTDVWTPSPSTSASCLHHQFWFIWVFSANSYAIMWSKEVEFQSIETVKLRFSYLLGWLSWDWYCILFNIWTHLLKNFLFSFRGSIWVFPCYIFALKFFGFQSKLRAKKPNIVHTKLDTKTVFFRNFPRFSQF